MPLFFTKLQATHASSSIQKTLLREVLWVGVLALWIAGGGLLSIGMARAETSSPPELIIYTYDSFLAQGGLGPSIFPIFEKKYGCRVKALSSGDGGQLLTRLQLDSQRGKPTAHLVVGIDQHQWGRLKPWVEPWGDWSPVRYDQLVDASRVEKGFLPYDYGAMAFMVDQKMKMKTKMPLSINDLLKPEWKRSVILEDPRTSTPGLAFLLYTQSVLGASVWNFWSQLRTQWLTLAPGWDGAYGLFLKEEAPLVWSYMTSQAYQEEHTSESSPSGRYQALLFKEGQPVQIEGAALVKGAIQSNQMKLLAQHFLEFLISPEVQNQIPRTHWMLPTLKGAELPPSFKKLPKPTRLIWSSWKENEKEGILKKWNQVVEQ